MVTDHDTKTVLDIVERSNNYGNDVCWQYDIRQRNRDSDLTEFGLTFDDIKDLRVEDFTFEFVSKDDKETAKDIKKFIERHEWLGKMSNYPTHYFIAKYNGILSGVVIMDMPNAFSKLLGEKTRKIERLISRGACISWSPKNLASSLCLPLNGWLKTQHIVCLQLIQILRQKNWVRYTKHATFIILVRILVPLNNIKLMVNGILIGISEVEVCIRKWH
jgi:hypothetical protein